jgi:putative flavoprotein involved in K+ transport
MAVPSGVGENRAVRTPPGGDHDRIAVQPAAEVEQWLSRFEDALTAGDSAAAAELFAGESFWRDLVSFTWNIKTVEGPEGVRDMLDHTLGHVKPRGFRTAESPAEAEGVTESGIEFETEAGRGRGHLRLNPREPDGS